MRKRIALAVFALLVMVTPLGIVAGSTVTGALYKMVVTIGNVGTAATNVATTCNLSSPNLIAGGFANSTVTNIAIQEATGADVTFMPGYDANPMVIWVPSIAASSYDQQILYLANSSGGDIAYFPGATGMAVSDNASLEPGNNYAFDIDGYFDTSTTSNIVYKGMALLRTNGTGIDSGIPTRDTTAAGTGSADNVYITRYWGQTFTTTSAYSIGGVTFTPFTAGGAAPTVLTVSLHAVDGAQKPTGAALATVDVPVASSPVSSATFTAPYALANATMYAIRFTHATGAGGASVWAFSYGANTYASGKLWMSNDGGASWAFDMGGDLLLTTVAPAVSYTCAPGEYSVRWSDNTTHQALYVDPSGTAPGTTLRDSTGDTSGIANSASNWAFGYGAATPYVNYIKMAIGGVPTTHWVWRYGATFIDSVSAVVGTPTFRTTTSDADVTASVGSFAIITPSEASAAALASPSDWYHTPTISGAFRTHTVSPTMPGQAVVDAITAASGTPSQLPWTIVTGVVILIISLAVSAMLRKGGSGSLIIKITLITGLLGVAVATQIFDLWMPIVFVLIASALAMGSQQRGWD